MFPTDLDLGYRYGRASEIAWLPQMAPLQLRASQSMIFENVRLFAEFVGATAFNRASSAFGEKDAASYALVNLGARLNKQIKKHRVGIHLGVDNVLDHYYTTHLSWNAVPLMGRSFWMAVRLEI